MLVLTRKPHEKIMIPAIKASIQVAAVKPGLVRVAINAPAEVEIRRGELPDRAAEWGPPQPVGASEVASPPALTKSRRGARERLGFASMTLGLARLQLRAGMHREAIVALTRVQHQIEKLCRRLDRQPRLAGRRRPANAQRAALIAADT
jgi:carbon storage regulator CsrA